VGGGEGVVEVVGWCAYCMEKKYQPRYSDYKICWMQCKNKVLSSWKSLVKNYVQCSKYAHTSM
jgi:hypothetical protein